MLEARLRTFEFLRTTPPYVLANVLIHAALCLPAAMLAG